jgi:uncharacterized protein YggU (UPF0235/DUF167 family)
MYIKIKAVPDAKIEKIEKVKDNEYRIWVKAPAENNAANNRLLELLRKEFPDVPVRLISGHHSPSKIFSIN